MNFVDSGALLALHLKSDQYHKKAIRLWGELEKPVTVASQVIGEFATLFARRAGYGFAAGAVADLLTSTLRIVRPTLDDEMEAVRWMKKYADQQIGFNDCVSFAIMKRYKIRTVFTFDRHFRIAGFDVIKP